MANRLNSEDFIGKRFGKIVVLSEAEKRAGGLRLMCKCDCGNHKVILAKQLKSGLISSCGCSKSQFLNGDGVYDISDLKFGKLTAVKRINNGQWEFKCDCGNTTITEAYSVTSGTTTSCGCFRSNKMKEQMSTYKKSKTPEYITWLAMKARCYNENSQYYHYYGGKGITVCDEWVFDFEKFLSDMGTRPFEGAMIDRINGDLGYSKENCRWVTNQQNQWNTKPKKSGKSKYKGLSVREDRNIIEVSITNNGRREFLGSFKMDDEISAAKAYDKRAKELFGEYAYLNFKD